MERVSVKRQTALDTRCQSGPSARHSFDPNKGRSSKDYGADQQRLQISDLHFDKFPNPATFACWKIRFKTEVCTCLQFPTEGGGGWISGWSKIFVFCKRNSNAKFWSTRCEDCFSTEQNHPEYPLQKKGQSGGIKKPKKRTVSFAEDRSLTWSTSTSGSLEPTILSRIMRTYLQVFFEMMKFRNSIQNGANFYHRWHKSHLMTSWKACTNWEYESLRKKLKTLLELYNMEIHQKKAGPDFHRLKTMVKRCIEQNLRMKSFEARNGNFEKKKKKEAVVKNQRVKTAWKKELSEIADNWKLTGSVRKETIAVSDRIWISVQFDTAESFSKIFYAAECDKCIENQKSQRQKPKWENGSTAVQGLPQKNLHHTILWKMASSRMLVLQVQNGCRFGEKCSYAHRQVDEQPSKSKKNGDKSALATLKITRHLGCVFQDMKPPNSASILRKSSDIRKPIRCVKFTKAVVRHTQIRDQNPSLGMICPGEPHQRSPNAPKFEDRSQEETECQERCARDAAWRLAKSILKKRRNIKQHSSHLRKNWCLPAPSTLEPEEREFVVDSGASMHMISEKDSNSAELETVTTSRSPTTVITANGEVQTHEEATVYVKELDIFLTMKVLENTPAILSLGKLCDEHGYSYKWINGQKPHLIKNGIRRQCNTENSVPIVVPGLSASLSSSFSFLKHQWHFQDKSVIILHLPQARLLHQPQLCQVTVRLRKERSEWDRFPSSTCVKFTCLTNRTGRPVVAQANQKSKTK